jgi:hypothetical protein
MFLIEPNINADEEQRSAVLVELMERARLTELQQQLLRYFFLDDNDDTRPSCRGFNRRFKKSIDAKIVQVELARALSQFRVWLEGRGLVCSADVI